MPSYGENKLERQFDPLANSCIRSDKRRQTQSSLVMGGGERRGISFLIGRAVEPISAPLSFPRITMTHGTYDENLLLGIACGSNDVTV